MKKRRLIYTGKAKNLYEGPEEDTLIQYFKDDVTAFNKEKHDIIDGKGVINNFISAFIMERLEQANISTSFIKRLNMREQLIYNLEMIPLEIVIRRKAAGSLVSRYGVIEEGTLLYSPLIEFFYKDDSKNDPLIGAETIVALDILDEDTLTQICEYTHTVMNILYGMFAGIGLEIIDLKLEFGKLCHPDFPELFDIFLADEISPDNCRLRCMKTGASFDKDLYRKGTGSLIEAYTEIARRLGLLPEIQSISDNKVTQIHADLKSHFEASDEDDVDNDDLEKAREKITKITSGKKKKK